MLLTLKLKLQISDNKTGIISFCALMELNPVLSLLFMTKPYLFHREALNLEYRINWGSIDCHPYGFYRIHCNGPLSKPCDGGTL